MHVARCEGYHSLHRGIVLLKEEGERKRKNPQQTAAEIVASTEMADNSEAIHPPHDLNAKWDACLDLTIRRFVYSSSAGAFGGLLFFRSPVTRWASIAFGAGVGIGSAYTECSRLFDGSSSKSTSPKISETPAQPTYIQESDEKHE